MQGVLPNERIVDDVPLGNMTMTFEPDDGGTKMSMGWEWAHDVPVAGPLIATLPGTVTASWMLHSRTRRRRWRADCPPSAAAIREALRKIDRSLIKMLVQCGPLVAEAVPRRWRRCPLPLATCQPHREERAPSGALRAPGGTRLDSWPLGVTSGAMCGQGWRKSTTEGSISSIPDSSEPPRRLKDDQPPKQGPPPARSAGCPRGQGVAATGGHCGRIGGPDQEWGYVGPQRAAAIIRNYIPPESLILDAACGSGLTGTAMQTLGYTRIVGIDISDGSLQLAKRTRVYEQVQQVDMQDYPLPCDDGTFDAISSICALTCFETPRRSCGSCAGSFAAAVASPSRTATTCCAKCTYLPRHPQYGDRITFQDFVHEVS